MGVVDFARAKEERTPHLSGAAVCLGCQEKWVAVAPVGTDALECPKCHLDKGRFSQLVEYHEDHFHCHCGNYLFCITKTSSYCPNCGEEVVLP